MAKAKKPLDQYSEEEIAVYRQAFVKSTLRRASYRWPWRNIAAIAARRGYGKYECAECKAYVRNKDKQMDHVLPVVEITTGFTGWDDYAQRLYVGVPGWQCLCRECHTFKTAKEREERKLERRKRKGP